MSIAVPGEIGTTMVTGRTGNGSSARAGGETANDATSASAAAATDRRFIGAPYSFLNQRHGADRRGLRVDQLERQADQREALLADAVEVLQVRHGDHAVLAQRTRIVKHAR